MQIRLKSTLMFIFIAVFVMIILFFVGQSIFGGSSGTGSSTRVADDNTPDNSPIFNAAGNDDWMSGSNAAASVSSFDSNSSSPSFDSSPSSSDSGSLGGGSSDGGGASGSYD